MANRFEDQLDAFFTGATYGIPELFGIEPPRRAQEEMLKAPGSAMVGSLLSGLVIPYGGWYGATTKIPRLAKLVQKAGELPGITSPTLRGAAREFGRFAPFEGGRIVGAAGLDITGSFGDVNLGEVVSSAALNLAFEAAGGAVIGKLAEAGKATKRGREHLGEKALEDHAVLQLRGLDEKVLTLPPEKLPEVQAYMKKLSNAVFMEEPPTKEFMNTLVEGQEKSVLNAIFKGTPDAVAHRLYANAKGRFKTNDEWMQEVGALGIDAARLDRYGLTPRVIDFGSTAAQMRTMNEIADNMTDIGNGWFLAKEIDDGFSIIAKQMPTTQNKPHGGLFMTSTDLPDWFRANQAARLNKVVEENMWARRNYKMSGGGGELGARAITAYQQLPYRTMQLIRQSGLNFDNVSSIAGKVPGVRHVKELTDNKNVRASLDFVKRIAAPTRFQLRNNPRAQHIFGLASAIKDDGGILAKTLMYGAMQPVKNASRGALGPVGNNLISHLNAVAEGWGHKGDGFMDAYKKLSQDEVKNLQELANTGAMDAARIGQLKAEGRISNAEKLFLDKAEIARIHLLQESASNSIKFGNIKEFPEFQPSFLSKSESGKVLSKKQLQDKLEKSVHGWTDSLTNNIVDNLFTGEMRMVSIEDQATGKMLFERMNDLKGQMRPFAAAINTALFPLLGKDGASNIAQGINQVMYGLTLAGVNTGYLVMNPIGVVTSVVPRAMMVINGRGIGVGDDMRYWPVPGVGTIGIWDGLKAMRATRKDIMDPDPMLVQMFDRAAADGKLVLGMVAEEVGAGAPSLRNIKQLLQRRCLLQCPEQHLELPCCPFGTVLSALSFHHICPASTECRPLQSRGHLSGRSQDHRRLNVWIQASRQSSLDDWTSWWPTRSVQELVDQLRR